jgi:hypothetical protein
MFVCGSVRRKWGTPTPPRYLQFSTKVCRKFDTGSTTNSVGSQTVFTKSYFRVFANRQIVTPSVASWSLLRRIRSHPFIPFELVKHVTLEPMTNRDERMIKILARFMGHAQLLHHAD